MPPKCAVKTCASRSNENKISFFSSPKDEFEREKWIQILSCDLKSRSLVCENHFFPQDINSEKHFKKGEEIIQTVSLVITLIMFYTYLNKYYYNSCKMNYSCKLVLILLTVCVFVGCVKEKKIKTWCFAIQAV